LRSTPNADGGFGTSGTGRGLVGHSDSQAGVVGDSDTFHGVFGICHAGSNSAGVFGTNTSGGFGVQGVSDDGAGVLGSSTNGEGVHGETNGNVAGVAGFNRGTEHQSAMGVFGHSDFGEGVHGETTGNGLAGVAGFSLKGQQGTQQGIGVFGHSDLGEGVHGEATANVAGVAGFNLATEVPQGVEGIFPGVFGRSEISEGVHGETNGTGTAAVVGFCRQQASDAVLGIAQEGGNAIHGIGGNFAGWFEGTVQIDRDLTVNGDITGGSIHSSAKFFLIDHPREPTDKYLQHSSVESFEMMNLYSGNVTTDHHGDATIILPDYFEALNTDFRYHLTAIGQFAQAIVATEIADNRFAIKTDKPRVKVSWQVAGIRQDAFAKAYPLVVEREKPAAEKGCFLHPQVHGQPEDKGIAWAQRATATCDAASAYRAPHCTVREPDSSALFAAAPGNPIDFKGNCRELPGTG
jgi:hypothetical protein